jgi:hypothetical protein
MIPIAAAGNDRGDELRARASRAGAAAARCLVQRHLGAPALVEYNAVATV